NEKPVMACPKDIVVPTDAGVCSAVVTFQVDASDNCPGVSVVATPPSGTAFPRGTTQVMATATDASGNTASCSFNVTVLDREPPKIVCPAPVTVNTDAGKCSASGV